MTQSHGSSVVKMGTDRRVAEGIPVETFWWFRVVSGVDLSVEDRRFFIRKGCA